MPNLKDNLKQWRDSARIDWFSQFIKDVDHDNTLDVEILHKVAFLAEREKPIGAQ